MHRYFFRNSRDRLMAGVGARKMGITIALATVAALDCATHRRKKASVMKERIASAGMRRVASAMVGTRFPTAISCRVGGAARNRPDGDSTQDAKSAQSGSTWDSGNSGGLRHAIGRTGKH